MYPTWKVTLYVQTEVNLLIPVLEHVAVSISDYKQVIDTGYKTNLGKASW